MQFSEKIMDVLGCEVRSTLNPSRLAFKLSSFFIEDPSIVSHPGWRHSTLPTNCSSSDKGLDTTGALSRDAFKYSRKLCDFHLPAFWISVSDNPSAAILWRPRFSRSAAPIRLELNPLHALAFWSLPSTFSWTRPATLPFPHSPIRQQ